MDVTIYPFYANWARVQVRYSEDAHFFFGKYKCKQSSYYIYIYIHTWPEMRA